MVGDVKARIVRSDGEELTIGDGDWRIPSDGLENWANLPYSVSSSEVPVTDGAIVTSKRVSAVDRTIHARATGDNPRKLREAALHFFNPKHSFTVYMTYMGRTLKCSGEQIGFAASEGNIYRSPEITWTILCPNPYLSDADGLDVIMDKTTPRFGFPWFALMPNTIEKHIKGFGFPWYSALPGQEDVPTGAVFGRDIYKDQQLYGNLRSGAIVATRDQLRSIKVNADGDVASGIKATIRSRGGNIVNPTVRVGYSYARIITRLTGDDVLRIDTTQLPPIVEINGRNAMHLMDRRSNLVGMVIESKDTQVSYDAESGEENMMVRFEYENRYLGI